MTKLSERVKLVQDNVQGVEDFDESEKKIRRRRKKMPKFRVNRASWIYDYAMKYMSKHVRLYSWFQLKIGSNPSS